jgi:hypothetical protein
MDTAVRASAAKQVLSRCEYFRDRLRENPTGVAFLAQFSGCLALLRSVGHVLQKVDAVSSRTLGANQAKWWADLNASHSEPKIFWRFIESKSDPEGKRYPRWPIRHRGADGRRGPRAGCRGKT